MSFEDEDKIAVGYGIDSSFVDGEIGASIYRLWNRFSRIGSESWKSRYRNLHTCSTPTEMVTVNKQSHIELKSSLKLFSFLCFYWIPVAPWYTTFCRSTWQHPCKAGNLYVLFVLCKFVMINLLLQFGSIRYRKICNTLCVYVV